jgi:hypothetical protein
MAENKKYQGKRWHCICIYCGRKTIKPTRDVKSYGCISCSKRTIWNFKKLHNSWRNMRGRCDDSKHKDYELYGARGITYYIHWTKFEEFKKWAITNGYKEGLELDRIDVNGNYAPENCRWVNDRTQANNRRSNRLFTIKNETHTLVEWARIYNINHHTVFRRLKFGYKIEDALTKKVNKKVGQKQVAFYTINGITKSLYDWCEVFQVSSITVKKRMKKGASLFEALQGSA